MELVPKLNSAWPKQGSPETTPELPVISFCPQSRDRSLIWWGSRISENLSVTVGFPPTVPRSKCMHSNKLLCGISADSLKPEGLASVKGTHPRDYPSGAPR